MIPELKVAIAQLRKIAHIVKDTQPVWSRQLQIVCDYAENAALDKILNDEWEMNNE